jgi:hypothetical protein
MCARVGEGTRRAAAHNYHQYTVGVPKMGHTHTQLIGCNNQANMSARTMLKWIVDIERVNDNDYQLCVG